MVDILPNQDGEEKEINKEEEIIDSGSEKNTDELNNIKLISFEEYNKLSDSEKKEYTRYNPSLYSQAYTQWLNCSTQISQTYNRLGPTLNSIGPLAKGQLELGQEAGINMMLEAIEPLFDGVDDVQSLLEEIKGLSDVEIIGTLAKPVYKILCIPFNLICAIGQTLYSMMMNPMNMINAMVQAYDTVDWEALEKQLKIMTESSENTPNLEELSAKMDKTVILDEEQKSLIDEQNKIMKANLETAKLQIENAKMQGEMMKKMQEAYKTYQEVQKKISTMGLDFLVTGAMEKALDQLEVDYNEVYEKTTGKYKDPETGEPINPYASNAKEYANQTNDFIYKMNSSNKYIKNTDLAILKNMENQTKD